MLHFICVIELLRYWLFILQQALESTILDVSITKCRNSDLLRHIFVFTKKMNSGHDHLICFVLNCVPTNVSFSYYGFKIRLILLDFHFQIKKVLCQY